VFLDSIPIADWSNYLTVQASVSATLTGLVFVAVSINLSRVLSIPGLTGRAAESLMQLFGVLLVSTSALVPGQTAELFGREVIVLASLLWFLQTTLQVRYMRTRSGHPKFWLVSRMLQTQLVNLPFFISGALLARGSLTGMYWLVPGFLLSLVYGVVGAWVLLVEILR
jgi:hypothetical protein